jgi:hypothetical protein
MSYEKVYFYYAKLVFVILLCIVYLPFSITDLYFGINSQELCITKKHEISMKDYLILTGYSETILLFVSIWIILTPANLITDKLIKLYLIVYSGIYVLYTIINVIGMYIYMTHVYKTCNGLSEYIFISLTIKFIFTIIIVYMVCK